MILQCEPIAGDGTCVRVRVAILEQEAREQIEDGMSMKAV